MVGWAFQLQDPRVILLLLLLVTAIALNLAGLFQLPMLAGGDGLARGGGAARRLLHRRARRLRRDALHRARSWASRSAPLWCCPPGRRSRCSPASASAWLCPSCCSASCRRCAAGCPGPGAWMATLPAHPLGADVPDRARPRLDPRAADRGRRHGARPRRRLAARPRPCGGSGSGGGWLAVGADPARRRGAVAAAPIPSRPRPAPAESPLGAEPFSEARLAELRAAGTPVFVYFTADWCLTCKVNERAALGQRRGRRGLPRTRHPGAGRRLDPRRRRRSAASSSATAARACRSTSIIRRAARPRCCRRSDAVSSADGLLARGGSRSSAQPGWLTRLGAGAAPLPDLLPADIGLEHLGVADLALVGGSRRCRGR